MARSRPRRSMRFWLLVLLIPGVVFLLVVDGRNDYRALDLLIQDVYDDALLEPAKVLENSVDIDAGGQLVIEPPFYVQVMLESRAGNRKYYRVEEIAPVQPSLGGIILLPAMWRDRSAMQSIPLGLKVIWSIFKNFFLMRSILLRASRQTRHLSPKWQIL